MKNINIIVLAVVGVIIIGGYLYSQRQIPDGNNNSEEEINNENYDNLNSEIIKFISDFDSNELNVTMSGEELTIELFEPDPENEDLGEIL